MINYFLRLDSKIENVLKVYSITHSLLNIRGANGAIMTRSNILILKKILNENFGKDIDLNNVESTIYEGIEQVFVSNYHDSSGYYEDDFDEDDFDDGLPDDFDDSPKKLLLEIDDVDAEISETQQTLDELKRKRELLDTKIGINELTRKETRESEKPFECDDTIIL